MDLPACISILNINGIHCNKGRAMPSAEIRFSVRRVHTSRTLAVHTQSILKEQTQYDPGTTMMEAS